MAGRLSLSYEERVAVGEIQTNPEQEAIVRRFDRMIEELGQSGGWFRKAPDIRGVYLWGPVGRGKTMLTDMLYRQAPIRRKTRKHFHTFMIEAHERLAAHRHAQGRQPIEALAEEMSAEWRLLVLDELQVKDIADATVLGRLFAGIIERGTVVVATSNLPPHRLYERGLNRELFLPFIRLVGERLDVMELAAPTDYRREKLAAAPTWHVPANASAAKDLDAAFLRLTGAPRGEREVLRVQGRDLVAPNARAGVARFSYAEICRGMLGPGDFGALARAFHTIIIDNIPALDTEPPDAVRRFVLLIDELYEQRVKLLASSEREPAALLTSGKQAEEFARTASRLVEMASQDWLGLPHGRPDDLNGQPEPR